MKKRIDWKRAGLDKEKACNIHFKNRMSERFSLNINRRIRHELVGWIQKGKGKHIATISASRSVIEVPIFLSKELCEKNKEVKFGDRLIVVYDKKRHCLVTVLPYNDFYYHRPEDKK